MALVRVVRRMDLGSYSALSPVSTGKGYHLRADIYHLDMAKVVDPYGIGGTCPPPQKKKIMKGGTSMVMYPQYFGSDII